MPKLVIVESPAKAKTIGKYLGSGYKVKASMGHLRDLPAKSKLGVDIEHGFEPNISAHPRTRGAHQRAQKGRQEVATPSILQPTRTARAKPSRGT